MLTILDTLDDADEPEERLPRELRLVRFGAELELFRFFEGSTTESSEAAPVDFVRGAVSLEAGIFSGAVKVGPDLLWRLGKGSVAAPAEALSGLATTRPMAEFVRTRFFLRGARVGELGEVEADREEPLVGKELDE